jgi:hypothetical protein
MSLADTSIRNAKSKDKPYKLTDGQGMYLLVHPNGSKYWRFKYLFHKKEKLLAFGTYPEISLSDARERRLAARKLVANGIDPTTKKREDRFKAILNSENTFKVLYSRK